MPPRFYAPAADDTELVALPPDEAHHLIHVLRLREGAAVRVFDGYGREWDARVARATRSAVTVERGAPRPPAPEPACRITLAVAVLKADYMETALRSAVMAGVHAIQPLVSAHSLSLPRGDHRGHLAERWRRIVVSSVKQCGRAVVPEVHDVQLLASWIADHASTPALRLLLAEPGIGERHPTDLLAWRDVARDHGAVLLVGPEGGWLPAEVERARAEGFLPWTVSKRVLRADAAALAAVSVLLYAWETG
jgi:16S rRNA (uracil1498-N3)-methyltransferase